MTLPLALLQGTDAQTNLILFGVITLALMVVLGKRFFVAMWEVTSAPGASIGHHGKDNTFFFHLMVVFLGGMIGLLILTYQQESLSQGLTSYANELGSAIASGNSNATYRDMVSTWASNMINKSLQTFVVGNFMWLPLLGVANWLIIGLLYYIFAKMFGTQSSASGFLGALSFSFFWSTIAMALTIKDQVTQVLNMLYEQPGGSSPDVMGIIGAVLGLYAFVLLVMGVVQGAEISVGQFIVCFLLLGILGGGLGWYLMTYQFGPQAAAFSNSVVTLDPSKPGFVMPGAGGAGFTPPPSTDSSFGSSSGSSSPPRKPGAPGSGGEGGMMEDE